MTWIFTWIFTIEIFTSEKIRDDGCSILEILRVKCWGEESCTRLNLHHFHELNL
jgi:hypothetical protein